MLLFPTLPSFHLLLPELIYKLLFPQIHPHLIILLSPMQGGKTQYECMYVKVRRAEPLLWLYSITYVQMCTQVLSVNVQFKSNA